MSLFCLGPSAQTAEYPLLLGPSDQTAEYPFLLTAEWYLPVFVSSQEPFLHFPSLVQLWTGVKGWLGCPVRSGPSTYQGSNSGSNHAGWICEINSVPCWSLPRNLNTAMQILPLLPSCLQCKQILMVFFSGGAAQLWQISNCSHKDSFCRPGNKHEI